MKLTLDEFPPATYGDWRKAAEESLKGAPFDKKLVTTTPEGIKLQPIYGKTDLEALSLPESWPGLPPFVRGSSASGYKGHPWLIAQELPGGCLEKFHAALKSDLMRGQNAVVLLPDVATRHGQDPDEAACGEVGECGLSLATLDDATRAFDGVDFQAAPVLVFAGASALPLAGLLQACSGDNGFSGAVLADPLTEWARDGKLEISLDDACAELAALSKWAAGKGLRTAGIQANLWADAGGTAVEELAFGLATGAAYFRVLAAAGVPEDEIAPRFVMALSLGSNLFMQIAKIRAARLLWDRMVGAFGVRPAPLFIHGRSSIFNKSVLDPHTNMLRATAEGFAGVVGGVDSMHVAAFDEPVRTPDEFSSRIARNIHVILAEECGFAEVADAAGGSWYVESLTIELAKKAWELFQEVEKRGGMAVALRKGFPQSAVAVSAKARLSAVSKRREAVLGVNLFPNPAESPLAPNHAKEKFAERSKRIASARKGGVSLASASVEEIAKAFQAGATIGEIRKALPRKGAGVPEIPRVRVIRAAEGYERLRAATRENPPQVWLAKFGPPKQSKARADFSSGFFAAGGYDVRQQTVGAKSVGEALDQAVASKAPVVVLCSTDDTYPEIVPAFVPALKSQMPGTKVLLAGYPPDQIEAHKASGVDDFIHIKVDCLAFLTNLHKEL